MTFGVVMLCHTAFDRAASVARFWAESGSPVVIHVDARARADDVRHFAQSLSGLKNISFSRRLCV